MKLHKEIDDFSTGQIPPQSHIPRYIGKFLVNCDTVFPYIFIKDRRLATIFFDNAQKRPNRRGLPCSIRSDKTNHLASFHGKTNIFQSLEFPKTLLQMCHFYNFFHFLLLISPSRMIQSFFKPYKRF